MMKWIGAETRAFTLITLAAWALGVQALASTPADQAKTTTPFLRPDQATRLVAAAPAHLKPLLIFLIGTGARMSEALELDWAQVDLIGARVVLAQKQGNQRHMDLPRAVLAALAALPHRDARVFRKAPTRRQRMLGQLADGYRDTNRDGGGGEIKTAFSSACARAGLPGRWVEYRYQSRNTAQRKFVPEFTPHGLRHTWASWHYCLHRDLIALKHAGGWSTVTVVERYAKPMPDAYRAQIEAWWAGRMVEIEGVETA